MRTFGAVVAVAVIGLAGPYFLAEAAASPVAGASFTGLGRLAGTGGSHASAVSGDGNVVVGYCATEINAGEAFRWTAAGGMQSLGLWPGYNMSHAVGVSADGSVVAGYCRAANPTVPTAAFRWTAAEGMVPLGTLGGAVWGSVAYDVSADGTVIVGRSSSAAGPQAEAFRWTAATGMQGLGFVPNSQYSQALGVSADGQVVVGYSKTSDVEEGHAFRWTAAGGMQDLGDLAGGGFSAAAHAASADGSVVVGAGLTETGHEPARWTAEDGMVSLGLMGANSGYSANAAWDVSDDGTVVLGMAGSVPFLWDDVRGMRALRTVLEDECGLDLDGWRLFESGGLSADGRTIVGAGVNPDDQYEAWMAVIPEPATLGLLALGGLALIRRRR